MTTPQKGRIFISYRRTDSAGYAGRIYDRLTTHFGEDTVFMDVDTIEAGLDFVEVLQNAVQSCDVLVALIGRSWLNIIDEAGKRRLDSAEDFVRVEITAALRRNIRVIPVLVDGASMPHSTELPNNLKPLARRNALQINHHSFNTDAQRLISQLELALKAAEDSKILKAQLAAEEQARARRQAEIERLLAQADLAIDLKDWGLAHEKLSDVLKLDASHVAARDKLDIVQRKISEREQESLEQARKEKEAREQAAAEERARLSAAQKAKKEREERERKAFEEKAREEKEQEIRRGPPSPREASPKGTGRVVRGEGKPAWLPYGIGGGVLIAIVLLFGIGNLIYKALVPVIPTETQRSPTKALATNVSPNPETSAPTATAEPQGTPASIPEELGIGSTMASDKDGMVMVYVPAGEFQMGSENGKDDEKPVHPVYLDAFWIDQTEITNAMYGNCVQVGECNQPSNTTYYNDTSYADHPVIYVSWFDAVAYCKWAGRSLPSEAEWEKAAGWDENAQTQRMYPWGNAFDGTKTNFCDTNCSYASKNADFDDGYAFTAPVGSYPDGKSFYGALDMAGNVWEWVSDWYDVYPGGDKNASNDFGQPNRVSRGGSWDNDDSSYVRSATRNWDAPAFSYFTIGFRCARNASP